VQLSSRAQAVADVLREHGASFFDELVDSGGLLRTQVEEALGELVAQGRVSSDSFAGLRALLTPSDRRKPFGGRRSRRTTMFGIEEAGRWSLLRRPPAAPVPTMAMPGMAPVVPPAATDGVKVRMVDNRFQPSVLTVPVGSTVTWMNNGTNVHTVSSYDGQVESGSENPGGLFAYTFNQLGEFKYICRQHLLSGMFGTIKVQ